MCRIIYQVITAIILQYNCMIFGLTNCMPSTTMLLFKSKNTSLDRPMTLTESALFASLPRIGALLAIPFMGYLLDGIGRKRCAVMMSTFSFTFWIVLNFAKKVEVMLFSVFFGGLSGPTFLLVSIYVSEICQESIRGRLSSCTNVSYSVGVLIGFIFGGIFEYQSMVLVQTIMAGVGLLLLLFVRESPIILMKKGLEEEAAKSMAFYRNSKPDSKVVQEDIEKIRRTLTPKYKEVAQDEEKLQSESKDTDSAVQISKWEFFKRSESTRRAFFLDMFLITTTLFQGMVVVQIYAKPIFKEAVPEEILSVTSCCVLLSVILVISGLVGAYLTDRAGRRILMITSTVATGVFHVALGSQIQFSWGPDWLTAVLVYLFTVAYTFGPGNIPFVMMAELFLPEIKGVISTVLMEWSFVCSFTCLFFFNYLVAMIGLGPVFYLFATVSFGSATVCYFTLPETKGLTIDAIQMLFVKKNVPV